MSSRVYRRELAKRDYADQNVEYLSVLSEPGQLFRCLHRLGAPRSGTLLDLGCGDGRAAVYAIRHEMYYIGADFSQPRVTAGRETYADVDPTLDRRPLFICTDLYHYMHHLNPGFELVLAWEVLEHLEHPEVLWRQMRRVGYRSVIAAVPAEPTDPEDPPLWEWREPVDLYQRFEGIVHVDRVSLRHPLLGRVPFLLMVGEPAAQKPQAGSRCVAKSHIERELPPLPASRAA